MDDVSAKSRAHLAGAGVHSVSGAAFMIGNGLLPCGTISILQATPVLGGCLAGAKKLARGCFKKGEVRQMERKGIDKVAGAFIGLFQNVLKTVTELN